MMSDVDSIVTRFSQMEVQTHFMNVFIYSDFVFMCICHEQSALMYCFFIEMKSRNKKGRYIIYGHPDLV